MKNSTRFLDAFVAIEDYLRKRIGHKQHKSFGQMLDMVGRKEATVRRLSDDLREFAQLRNAIVHDRAGGEIIAEPNKVAVAAIEHAAQLILEPPRLLPTFKRKMIIVSPHQDIGSAISLMYRHNITKLPVLEKKSCRGLLTSHTLTRWLGECVDKEVLNLNDTTVSEVLAFTRYQDHVTFRSRNTTMFEALELFEQQERRGKRLDAILITQSGKKDERLLGIMTISDIPTAWKIIES